MSIRKIKRRWSIGKRQEKYLSDKERTKKRTNIWGKEKIEVNFTLNKESSTEHWPKRNISVNVNWPKTKCGWGYFVILKMCHTLTKQVSVIPHKLWSNC